MPQPEVAVRAAIANSAYLPRVRSGVSTSDSSFQLQLNVCYPLCGSAPAFWMPHVPGPVIHRPLCVNRRPCLLLGALRADLRVG